MRPLIPALYLGLTATLPVCLAQQMARPLPQALPGSSYAAQLSIPPGLGYPFAKCELTGQAPRWLTLDCARLQLKGKVPPASAGRADASYLLDLQIEDAAGNSRTFPLSLRVSNQPQVVSLEDSQTAGVAVAEASPVRIISTARLTPAVAKDDFPESQTPLAAARPAGATTPSEAENSAVATALASSVASLRPGPLAGPEPIGQDNATAPANGAAPAPTEPSAGNDPKDKKQAASQQNAKGVKAPTIVTTSLTPASAVISGTGGSAKKVTLMGSGGYSDSADVGGDNLWSVHVERGRLTPGEVLTPHGDDAGVGAPVTVEPKFRFGDDMHAILGFQQSGASSGKSDQAFFFDFYINRPLIGSMRSDCHAKDTGAKAYVEDGDTPDCDRKFHWWGNVRVASYPQTISTPVGTFAASFAQNIANTPVNKLAQAAEFLTGFEYMLKSTSYPVIGRSEDSRQRYSLALFAGFGATSPLDATDTGNYSIYAVPAPSSPQYPTFNSQYPGISSTYVAFTPPDHNLFYAQYLAGLRYSTHFADEVSGAPFTSPPALVSVGLGQNEEVTEGVLRGVIARFDAFYPLPLSGRRGNSSPWQAFNGVYLFGSAQMRLARPSVKTPLVLAAAPYTVKASDADVSIVPVRNNRDLYTIGVGVDTVQVVSSLMAKTKKP